jgi:hypothetical protein
LECPYNIIFGRDLGFRRVLYFWDDDTFSFLGNTGGKEKLDIRGNADEKIIANNSRSIGCPNSTDGGSSF